MKEAARISKNDMKEFASTIQYGTQLVSKSKYSLDHLHELKLYISYIESSDYKKADTSHFNEELLNEILENNDLGPDTPIRYLHMILCKLRDYISDHIKTEPLSLKLSKTNILMNLYIRFLGIDRYGVAKRFNIYECAELIGCSVQQLKNNLNQLMDLDILMYAKTDYDNYTIWLQHYDRSAYQEKIQEGSSYMYLTKDCFKELATTKDVHALRMSLRQIINSDNARIHNNLSSPSMSFKNIKEYLPTSLRNKKAIENLVINTKTLFDSTVINSKVIFTIKDRFVSYYNKTKGFVNEVIESKVDQLINESKEQVLFDINEKDRKDLLQLTVQYGFDILKRDYLKYLNLQLKIMEQLDDPLDLSLTFNLGYVRNFINEELNLSTNMA